MNARPTEIIFTSGGTEANNLAIRGLIEGQTVRTGPHIITSSIEHPSVENAVDELGKLGASVTRLPANENGIVRIEDLKGAIRDETVLISVMAANNEIGTIQPISEIGKLIRGLRAEGRKIWFHTDAVQSAGKVNIDVEEIGCDMLTISAHKIYAPKGVGALYVRRGTRLRSQNVGGRQERGFRGGTESVPLITAFGKAAETAVKDLDAGSEKLRDLRDRFEDLAFERIDNAERNGDKEARVPNISNISFRGIEGEALLINLDMQGFAVSTGSACSSGSLEPSPVIRALGADDARARSAIRFSFGKQNTEEEIDRLLAILPASVERLRQLSPGRAALNRS